MEKNVPEEFINHVKRLGIELKPAEEANLRTQLAWLKSSEDCEAVMQWFVENIDENNVLTNDELQFCHERGIDIENLDTASTTKSPEVNDLLNVNVEDLRQLERQANALEETLNDLQLIETDALNNNRKITEEINTLIDRKPELIAEQKVLLDTIHTGMGHLAQMQKSVCDNAVDLKKDVEDMQTPLHRIFDKFITNLHDHTQNLATMIGLIEQQANKPLISGQLSGKLLIGTILPNFKVNIAKDYVKLAQAKSELAFNRVINGDLVHDFANNHSNDSSCGDTSKVTDDIANLHEEIKQVANSIANCYIAKFSSEIVRKKIESRRFISNQLNMSTEELLNVFKLVFMVIEFVKRKQDWISQKVSAIDKFAKNVQLKNSSILTRIKGMGGVMKAFEKYKSEPCEYLERLAKFVELENGVGSLGSGNSSAPKEDDVSTLIQAVELFFDYSRECAREVVNEISVTDEDLVQLQNDVKKLSQGVQSATRQPNILRDSLAEKFDKFNSIFTTAQKDLEKLKDTYQSSNQKLASEDLNLWIVFLAAPEQFPRALKRLQETKKN